jgi:hypothetical protein
MKRRVEVKLRQWLEQADPTNILDMYQAPSSKLKALVGALGIMAGVVACDAATGIEAQFNNLEAKPTVYAMNSAPVTLPAAIAVRSCTQ